MKAVIFDLDDTLFPERTYVLSGFRAVGDWISETYSIRGFFGNGNLPIRRGAPGPDI